MSIPTKRSGSERRKDVSKGTSDYLRYTGLGLSMAGIILGATLLGVWLDQQVGLAFPAFTLVLSMLGIAGAMVHLFKETGRK